ncbi:MAG: hypothetical protein JSR60_08190 [Proteobacteria bacterium]|nr:hypothetical protein [Pseudomonadota bacterium]
MTLPATLDLNRFAEFAVAAGPGGGQALIVDAFGARTGFQRHRLPPGPLRDLAMTLIDEPAQAGHRLAQASFDEVAALLDAGVISPRTGLVDGAPFASLPLMPAATEPADRASPGWRLARALCPPIAVLDEFVPTPVVSGAAEHFVADGLVALDALLSERLCDGLEQYYAKLAGLGLMARAQRGVDRQIAFSDPAGLRLQRLLQPLVAAIVGVSIGPSYTLACRYGVGAVLPMHTDRAACQYTLSLQLGDAPNGAAAPWPFHIVEKSGAVRDILLRRGAGVLFLGRERAHGRPALLPEMVGGTLLLHYIDAEADRGSDQSDAPVR